MEVALKARIAIQFKPGVLDPEAQTIGKSLKHMGFDEVQTVNRVRLIELELQEGSDPERLDEMCGKLLANPVIEDYQIELIS